MAFSSLPAVWVQWVTALTAALDPRSAPRLARLLLGAVLATGRRTVTAWVRAAALADQCRPAYATTAAAGRRADALAARLAHAVLKPLLGGQARVVLAVDDTPTERYGPKVQGAGVHHNPTPGPAGHAFVYGHSWVVLAWLAGHPAWGTIALPLLARLYIRRKDLDGIPEPARPAFRTKLELAAELVRWAVAWLGGLGKPVWVAADGAFAARPFLKPVLAAGVTVVSRLRQNARLWSLPPAARRPGQRGPLPTYGKQRIDLAKRAGQRRGWRTDTFDLYGRPTATTYKTFVATWRPAGGQIRVVLVKEPHRWVPFFCTDPAAGAADVLRTIADRFSLETAFRDVKQSVGAGQQQVRKVATNVGAFHVCLWAYTLTEAWAWGRSAAEVVDRSDRPWDDPTRRPSHADKRRLLRRALLGDEIRAALGAGSTAQDFTAVADRLLDLAA
jgi:hypothetical protein